MIRKTVKIIAVAAVVMFGLFPAFAQESNISLSTFGEIVTDADNFLDSTDWGDVDFNGVFAFSRFGANIPQGIIDIGAAFWPGGFYMGLYYNGRVTGNYESSFFGRRTINSLDIEGSTKAEEAVNVYARNKLNPEAVYGVLAGFSNGVGIKFTFKDSLGIYGEIDDGGDPSANPTVYSEKWVGHLIPSVEAGIKIGPITKIGLSLPLAYNGSSSTEISLPGTGNATYSISTLDSNGDVISNAMDLLEAEGNYAQPDIYVKMGFGGLILENNLRFRIFSTPSVKMGGGSSVLGGVGYSETVYDIDKDDGSDANKRTSVWDSRAWFENEIKPSYNINGENDSGKLTYSATAALPFTIRLVSHSLNVKSEISDPDFANDQYDISGFYKASGAMLKIAPVVSAGVKFQLARLLSVQGGVLAELFSWTMENTAAKKASVSDENKAVLAGLGLGASSDSSDTQFTFAYPRLSLAAGFTFNLNDNASFDLLLIKYAVPSAAGTIYKAVGDGVGNGDTSIVISVKF